MDYDLRDFLIQLFILAMLIGLSLAIHINYINLSCEKCKIKFQSELPITNEITTHNIHPDVLYDGLMNKNCPLTWTKSGGYQYVGDLE